MKIGILTYHWVYNFGANLQVFVLSQILKEMGHEAVVLDYRASDLESFYLTRVKEPQRKIQDEFIVNNLKLTKKCSTEDELLEVTKSEAFDGIIVGSDSLWRVLLDGETSDVRYPNIYWLDWLKDLDIPVVSLSVSTMGSLYPRLPLKMQKKMYNSLKQFDYLSVRDRWSYWMLRWISFGKLKPEILPDPVFASGYMNQDNIIDKKVSEKIKDKKYFICTMYTKHVDIKVWNKFKEDINNKGYELYELPHPEGPSGLKVDKVIELPLTPKEWFTWFHHCSGYLGEKFHPVVVSLANNKPFISIDNYTENRLAKLGFYHQSKIFDLLRKFNLKKWYYPLNKIAKINDMNMLLEEFPIEKSRKNVISYQEKFIEELKRIIDLFDDAKVK